jgi:hypothetical protein
VAQGVGPEFKSQYCKEKKSWAGVGDSQDLQCKIIVTQDPYLSRFLLL